MSQAYTAPNTTPVVDSNGKITPIWSAYFDSLVRNLTSANTPSGATMAFEGTEEPAGWFFCDGRELSRGTYSDLYKVIGTRYGVGDGSTTFNLPDRRGKFMRGTTSMGTLEEGGTNELTIAFANLPAVDIAITDPGHTHAVTDPGHAHTNGGASNTSTGAGGGSGVTPGNTGTAVTGVTIATSPTNITARLEGGAEPIDIQPEFISVSFIIKY